MASGNDIDKLTGSDGTDASTAALDALREAHLAEEEAQALVNKATRILDTFPSVQAEAAFEDNGDGLTVVVEGPPDAESFNAFMLSSRTTKAAQEFAHVAQSFERQHAEKLRRTARARQVTNFMDGWGILLPARVFNEELGDYLEDIHRRVGEGQRFRLYLRVLAAMFWTGVNSFGYFLKQVGKTKSA